MFRPSGGAEIDETVAHGSSHIRYIGSAVPTFRKERNIRIGVSKTTENRHILNQQVSCNMLQTKEQDCPTHDARCNPKITRGGPGATHAEHDPTCGHPTPTRGHFARTPPTPTSEKSPSRAPNDDMRGGLGLFDAPEQ